MAGSTNFLQHNPSAANQESDLVYIAESIRTGGLGIDEIVPSNWLNKILYQATTGMTAFTQAMANKGYVLSDANVSTLTGVFSNVLTNADLKALLVNTSFSPAAHFDASKSNGFQMILTANANTCSIGGWAPGQIITFIIVQDATGGRSFTIPGVNQWQGLNNLAPNAVNVIQIIGKADGSLWWCGQELVVQPFVKQGGGIGQLSNNILIGWSSTRLKATVDATDLGNIVFDSQLSPVSTVANNAAAALAAFKALFTGTLAAPGFFKIGTNSGLEFIIQWGNVAMPGSSGSTNPTNVTFPVTFPNACLHAQACTFGTIDRISWVQSNSTSGMVVSNNGSGVSCNWFAVGF